MFIVVRSKEKSSDTWHRPAAMFAMGAPKIYYKSIMTDIPHSQFSVPQPRTVDPNCSWYEHATLLTDPLWSQQTTPLLHQAYVLPASNMIGPDILEP